MSRLLRSWIDRDLVVAVVVTVVAQVELWMVADRVTGPLVGHSAVGLLLFPALVLRRRRPTVAAVVCGVALGVQTLVGTAPIAIPFLVLLVVLASLGWYASVRQGLLGLGVVLAGGIVFDATTDDFILADLVVNVAIIVAAWAGGRLVRIASDKRIRAEVEAARARQEAIYEERGRISRDLHDSLAHALTLITLQAGGTRERIDDPLAAQTLGTIEDAGRQALADMHRFLKLLEAPTDSAPGLGHLEDLVEGVRRSGVPVTLDVDAGPLPTLAATTVYRIVQEALTNVVRHSEASSAAVRVFRSREHVIASIESTGRPRPGDTTGSGRGLVGLRERLAACGGELRSNPLPHGWLVEASIPLDGAVTGSPLGRLR